MTKQKKATIFLLCFSAFLVFCVWVYANKDLFNWNLIWKYLEALWSVSMVVIGLYLWSKSFGCWFGRDQNKIDLSFGTGVMWFTIGFFYLLAGSAALYFWTIKPFLF